MVGTRERRTMSYPQGDAAAGSTVETGYLFDRVFEESCTGMALVQAGGRYLRANRALCRLLGRSEEELRQLTVLDVTYPEDRAVSDQLLRRSLDGDRPAYELEKRYMRPDGSPVWVMVSATLLRDAAGKPICFLGQVLDLSERKRAAEERERLLARLAEVEERERARIARELHEGLGQLLMSIALAAQSLEDSGTHPDGRVAALRKVADEAVATARTLAYELRPLDLSTFGLEAAVSRLAVDLEVRTGVPIGFHGAGLDRALPAHIETAVYRIVQESLTNALKHADATSISIVLDGSDSQLIAIVEDDGTGFDCAAPLAVGRCGMGMVHMRERARLVGGELLVESEPGEGTTVRVIVPLPSGGSRGATGP